MKKFNFKQIRLKKIDINDIDDRLLLINLYITQSCSFLLGFILIILQKNNEFLPLFSLHGGLSIAIWGTLFAIAVLAVDFVVGRWVPEHVTDDGGVNERIFGNRPLWHIIVMTLIVSLCEETLFRGALQHWMGPYWTSILFAAIHIRYLQHWLMTGLVFSISYGLGWIYIHTGSLLTPIVAHFMIDLCMGCIIRYRRES